MHDKTETGIAVARMADPGESEPDVAKRQDHQCREVLKVIALSDRIRDESGDSVGMEQTIDCGGAKVGNIRGAGPLVVFFLIVWSNLGYCRQNWVVRQPAGLVHPERPRKTDSEERA